MYLNYNDTNEGRNGFDRHIPQTVVATEGSKMEKQAYSET